MFADGDAFDERVNDFILLDLVSFKVEFLESAFGVPDQFHEFIAEFADGVIRHV